MEFSGGGKTFHMTLSIGIVEGEEPVNVLVEKADRAMYRSKNRGKNTTTRFENDETFHMKLS